MELPATKRAYELTLAETLGVANEDLGDLKMAVFLGKLGYPQSSHPPDGAISWLKKKRVLLISGLGPWIGHETCVAPWFGVD